MSSEFYSFVGAVLVAWLGALIVAVFLTHLWERFCV